MSLGYKMPYIKTVDEEEASGELKDVYNDILTRRGRLSNILKLQSLNPESLKAHLDFYMSVMFAESSLSPELKEMIAIVVSAANQCEYCVAHHSNALNIYWKDETRINKFVKDYTTADIKNIEKIILCYAYNLTRLASTDIEQHVKLLRDSGLTDREILQVNLITSYFNFANRVAMGLGAEDDNEYDGYK